MQKLQPLYNRIAVRRMSERKISSGGLVIPDRAQEKPDEGTVVAVGDGRYTSDGQLIPLKVHIGDHVLFGKYSPNVEVSIDGEPMVIMSEDEILGIITDVAPEVIN